MNDEEFDRLVSRCRIRLAGPEKARIKKEVDEVIKYFDNISRIECDLQPEAYHPVETKGRTRKDEVEEYPDAAGLLKNTKTYRFYVIGPKV